MAVVLAFLCITAWAEEKEVSEPKSASGSEPEKVKLPRVLILGDSISIGYTPGVQELLRGKAFVHHPPDNCESTLVGLRKLDEWLGNEKWDLIHFNWGLHDVKYVDEQGQRVPPDEGKRQVPLAQYKENLDKLVLRLKETGAKLIFATTTPVPAGAFGRIKGDGARYNAAATEIMNKHGVAINDLYELAAERLAEIQRPENVHFTEPKGNRVLAERVAAAIMKALDQPEAKGRTTVRINTSKGEIVLELNRQAAPRTVANFLRYVEEDYYDGTIFHRVIKDFMIQGGGFTKDMNRKPTHPPIANEASNGLKNLRGTIAMARTSDPNSATGQFFINHSDNPFLDYGGENKPGYAVFGKVIKGMGTVDAIAAVQTTTRIGMRDVPIEPVMIESAELVQTP